MVVIGDEILGGYVTDRNSPWLARRLQAHGVPLSCVQVVPDDHAAIDEALRTELARPCPRLVFTSGGIGSTPDDITYEAVAASLGRGLVVDPVIAERVEQALSWTRAQGVGVDRASEGHFMRMARVPEGGRLLLREQGWAPGVVVDVDGGCREGGASVAVLPGVPSEFRAIVSQVVEPAYLAGRNELPVVVEVEHHFPESALNLTFAQVLARFPDVRLGSYPGAPMLVRLTGPADQVAEAAATVRDAVAALESSPEGARLAAAWAAKLDPEQLA